MSQFQNTNLQVFVGNAETVPTETTPTSFKADGGTGEVKVLDAKGGDVTSSTKEIIVYRKRPDGDLQTSEPIKVENIERLNVKAHTAQKQIVRALGFDGSTGSIDTINNNLYQVVVEMKNYGGHSDELRYRKLASYQSNASGTTQLDVAKGITKSLIWNFNREPSQRIRFKMLATTGSDVALGTGVDNVVFTKGSRFISATDIDDATTNSAFAAGDLIRVGTSATDDVYEIKKINASNNTAELDREFTGDTTTIADTDLKRVAKSDVNSLDYGVEFRGLSGRYELGKFVNKLFDFEITTIDFGSTPTSLTQSGVLGYGVAKNVADMEWFAQGNFGELYRTGEPELYDYRSNLSADLTNTYDVMSFTFAGRTRTGFQENVITRQFVIYTNSASAHAAMNGIINDLHNLPSVSLSTL